jgi:hypothetical protein
MVKLANSVSLPVCGLHRCNRSRHPHTQELNAQRAVREPEVQALAKVINERQKALVEHDWQQCWRWSNGSSRW